ncbi:hypothetical protein [Yoonia sp. 2307UL14-13]|uniref:hypothetical protein n=1 Tax=Yoonia sp. 2307UL14-13 TaxID=3126506 RepID=UPI0030AF6F5E
MFVTLCAILFGALPCLAQDRPDPALVAATQGVCEPFGVAAARYAPDGHIAVTCNEDATAFVPILGGVAPALGLAAAVLAQSIAGGNATPDTR